jgi:hypothetical protein
MAIGGFGPWRDTVLEAAWKPLATVPARPWTACEGEAPSGVMCSAPGPSVSDAVRDRLQDWRSGMTRYVIDAGVGLHLVRERVAVSPAHELLAPTLFRSQTLSLAHESVVRGEIPASVALEQLEQLWQIRIRLLGDAVLRRLAWKIADRLPGCRPTTPNTSRSPNCRVTPS